MTDEDLYGGLIRLNAVSKMRVGPLESVCRRRFQTTLSCIGKELVVSVREKVRT